MQSVLNIFLKKRYCKEKQNDHITMPTSCILSTSIVCYILASLCNTEFTTFRYKGVGKKFDSNLETAFSQIFGDWKMQR